MAIVTSNQITFIDNTNTQQYLYIRYSDDGGKTFTNNDGLDPGVWLGTCVTTSAIAPSNLSEYTWKKIVGEAGKDGVDGIPGTSTYFYVRYSSSDNGSNMTDTPQSDSEYLGVCSTTKSTAPTSPEEYTWSLIKGADGQNGSPGTPGDNGQTSYLHIKYSDDGINFTEPNGETIGKYIGTYVDFTETDSSTFNDYKWKKFVGEAGASANLLKASNTVVESNSYTVKDYNLVTDLKPLTTYTIVTCAEFTNESISNKYLAVIVNNKVVSSKFNTVGQKMIVTDTFTTDDTISDGWSNIIRYRHSLWNANMSATIYWCALYEGAVNAPQIWMPSSAEAVGTTLYTWIRYANEKDYSDMDNDPTNKQYIGIAYNKETSVESEDPGDYTWSLIKGSEGKGIENVTEYYLVSSKSTGITTEGYSWQTAIPTMTSTNKYLWNYEKTEFTTGDIMTTEPMIIGVYGTDGKNGQDGRGITLVENLYATSSDTIAPTEWSINTPDMSKTNKYLWNYEKITYTDGSSTETAPAIIGVYGDSGENAIQFGIYCSNGRIFKEGIESITLNSFAYDGTTKITNGATYSWWYYGESDEWVLIANEDTNELMVDKDDSYAKKTIKCIMRYADKQYEAYETLIDEVVIYTATINFMNGTNVLKSTDQYVVGCIVLYRNNKEIDDLFSYNCYDSVVNIENGVVTTTVFIPQDFNEDYLHFVYQDQDELKISLCEYVSSGVWQIVDTDYNYSYEGSYGNNNQLERVFVIPRNEINQSESISFSIKTDAGVVLTETSANIVDLNDPIINAEAPTNPIQDQLWLDTSSEPIVLKIWNGTKWVESGNKQGNNTYTSKPIEYDYGDIWILGFGEKFEKTDANGNVTTYTQGDTLKAIGSNVGQMTSFSVDSGSTVFYTDVFYGSVRVFINQTEIFDGWGYTESGTRGMLTFDYDKTGVIVISAFNDEDWEDIQPEITSIKQCMEFNSQDGLKIKSQTSTGQTPFYVSINSTNMGFHSVQTQEINGISSGTIDHEVVSVGINEATINNPTLKGTIRCDGNIRLQSNWVLKIESNGSLSLVNLE